MNGEYGVWAVWEFTVSFLNFSEEAMATPDRRMRNRPRVRTLEPTTGERHASWLELFFDLVFVLAVAQVARVLAEHSDLVGLVRYAVLFIPVWWAWIGFTFYADRFESEGPAYRILMFAAMLAMTAFALTLGGAFTPAGDTPFIICYVLVRLVLVVGYLRVAYYIPLARSFSMQYPIGLGAMMVLLLVSLLTDPPLRYAIWAVALILELLTPLLNLRAARVLPIDRSHIPERFGLFTIIVLGEAVIATAMGAAGVPWNLSTIATSSLGFGMAVCIWWINFDFVEGSGLTAGQLWRRFLYIYGHYFIVVSIVAMGIGVEHAIKESTEAHLHFPTVALIAGGAAVFLAVVTIIRVVTGVCDLIAPRLAGIGVLLSLLFLGQFLPPVAVMATAFLLLAGTVWFENYFAQEDEADELPHLVPCEHVGEMQVFKPRGEQEILGCEECRKNNYKWVHLRLCLSCGHVGCCDTSVNKHATKHFHKTGHPIIASLEAGESWAWCYVNDRFVPLESKIEGSEF